jgi:hypothetical protein
MSNNNLLGKVAKLKYQPWPSPRYRAHSPMGEASGEARFPSILCLYFL